MQADVLRLVDDPHPAAADLFLNAIVRDDLPGLQGSSWQPVKRHLAMEGVSVDLNGGLFQKIPGLHARVQQRLNFLFKLTIIGAGSAQEFFSFLGGPSAEN